MDTEPLIVLISAKLQTAYFIGTGHNIMIENDPHLLIQISDQKRGEHGACKRSEDGRETDMRTRGSAGSEHPRFRRSLTIALPVPTTWSV